ncbi:glycoside hydrolase family 24 protein, partial [Mycena pura]
TCVAPGPNAATISFIKQFEGFVASLAPDPIGLPTVGFGHLCQSKGCAEVPFSFPLSQATASHWQLLTNDLGQFVTCVNSAVSNSVTLNDNQVGALVSFSFNLGCGTLKSSTLLKRLNNGEDPNTVTVAEIPKFDLAGGKVLAGLVKRRAAEVTLFQTPSQVKAHPC